jgi:integrase
MANATVGLVRRVKTDAGWKYFPAAYWSNGRVKPEIALVDGREVKHEQGHYELRYYVGSKVTYESLKDATPAAAEDRRKRKEAQLAVGRAAIKANVQIVPTDPKRKPLKDALKQFLADTVDRGSMEAEEVYRFACNEFLTVTDRTYVDEFVPDDMRIYQRALRDRGLAKRTVSNRTSNVKAFLLYLGYDAKTIPKSPKPEKTMPEIYSDEELRALFKAVTKPRMNLLFSFLLTTGAREQEAMHSEWTDITAEARTIRFHSKPQYTFRMKDFEERELAVPPDLMKALLAFKKDHADKSPLIFGRNGKPDGHLLRALKGEARAAGLNCGKCENCLEQKPGKPAECGNWYLHKFRASYCTRLLRTNKLDIRTIQKMMGHGDLASTMRYVRPAEDAHTQSVIADMKWF